MVNDHNFKSGFVSLVGRPNVGKSSLMNAFVGQKITIISPKPQTTRNQLRGILTGSDHQIIWVDTPGIHRPKHKLGERMNKTAYGAFANDLILLVLDAKDGLTGADSKVIETIRKAATPVYLVWNKIDLQENKEKLPLIEGLEKVFYVSALTEQGLAPLLGAIIEELPKGPAYYPPEMLTDNPERFLAGEFIREQILKNTEEEVPHSIAVLVDQMKERENGMTYIGANIYVERDSQKGIIIGAKGAKLKEIGQAARKDLEELLETPVYLDLWVKVRKNWRNKDFSLRDFGYQEQK